MGTGRTLNRAPMTRPRKTEADKNKRMRVQMKRLTALGVPDEKLKHMTSKEVRQMLRVPEKTRVAFAN